MFKIQKMKNGGKPHSYIFKWYFFGYLFIFIGMDINVMHALSLLPAKSNTGNNLSQNLNQKIYTFVSSLFHKPEYQENIFINL